MKKIAILLLAVILAACSSAPTAAPTEPPAPTVIEPSQTPVVIVQTVVVEATQPPTLVPSPTAEPSTAVPASPTAVVVTVVVEATQPAPAAQAPTTAPVDTSGGVITVDQNLGAGWFTNMTFTKDILSLRCQLNKEITFSVKPLDANIADVNFYYRIVDRSTGAAFDWQNAGRMPSDANGNFVLAFSGDDVNANFRKSNAWLDFQFVGLSRSGGVVGRSEKIEQKVTYTLDCP
jgi:hypothetical protein